MFASEAQRLAACLALVRPLGLDRRGFWGPDGPTDATIDLVEGKGCPLSSGEQIVLRVAMDVWNGRGRARLDYVLGRLDEASLRRIGTLLTAIADGETAIGQWLDANAWRGR